MSLRPLTTKVTFSGLRLGLRDLGHLLEVVDDDQQAPVAGQLAMLLDELADVVDGARRLRAAEEEQVLAVAGDAVERRPQARVVGEVAAPRRRPPIHVPRISLRTSWILIAPVFWGRCASADSSAISRLSRYCSSCSKQMYRTLAWPPRRDVARHLEGHRRLAGALGAADEQQLARPRGPSPIVLSSGVKPSGTGWYSPSWPVATLSLRSTRTSSAERGAMLPLSVSSRQARSLGSGGVVSVATIRWSSPSGSRGRIVAPRAAAAPAPSAGPMTQRYGARELPPVTPARSAPAGSARAARSPSCPRGADRPDARLVVREHHGLVRGVGVVVGVGEAEQDDRQAEHRARTSRRPGSSRPRG